MVGEVLSKSDESIVSSRLRSLVSGLAKKVLCSMILSIIYVFWAGGDEMVWYNWMSTKCGE